MAQRILLLGCVKSKNGSNCTPGFYLSATTSPNFYTILVLNDGGGYPKDIFVTSVSAQWATNSMRALLHDLVPRDVRSDDNLTFSECFDHEKFWPHLFFSPWLSVREERS